jgi:8-oxo-dGTP diphosphatase
MEATVKGHPIPVVRALISDSVGRVLVLRRSATDHGAGYWCLPGGKMDYGETAEAALARELFEETRLRLVSCEFFLLQDNPPEQAEVMHCITHYYICRTEGEVLINDESCEFAWIGPGDLAGYEIVFRNDEAIRLYFRAAAALD